MYAKDLNNVKFYFLCSILLGAKCMWGIWGQLNQTCCVPSLVKCVEQKLNINKSVILNLVKH